MEQPQAAKTSPSEEQPVDVREIEDVLKSLHMKDRAMRIDETPEEYRAERETSWEIRRAHVVRRSEANPQPAEAAEKQPANAAERFMANATTSERRELRERLAAMSQDEYAAWLEDHLLEEHDLYNQLVCRPEFRVLTSNERAQLYLRIKETPEYALYKVAVEDLDQFWLARKKLGESGGVRTVGEGSAWSNFEINDGVEGHSESKGYLTFKEPERSLTPKNLTEFMRELQIAGYNGQVKVPALASGLLFRFDNVVFHGDADDDTEIALSVAKKVFGDQILRTQKGADGDNAEGKHSSHTQLLAERVEHARRSSAP